MGSKSLRRSKRSSDTERETDRDSLVSVAYESTAAAPSHVSEDNNLQRHASTLSDTVSLKRYGSKMSSGSSIWHSNHDDHQGHRAKKNSNDSAELQLLRSGNHHRGDSSYSITKEVPGLYHNRGFKLGRPRSIVDERRLVSQNSDASWESSQYRCNYDCVGPNGEFRFVMPARREEIEMMFQSLLERRDVQSLPENVRTQMMDYPLPKKWTLIYQDALQEYHSERRRANKDINEKSTPEWFVKIILSNSFKICDLRSLTVSLRSRSIDWVTHFLDIQGLVVLSKKLWDINLLLLSGNRESEEAQELLVRSIKLMLNSNYGANAALEHQAVINVLAMAMICGNLSSRKTAAEVITFLCYWEKPRGLNSVYSALHYFTGEKRPLAENVQIWAHVLSSGIQSYNRLTNTKEMDRVQKQSTEKNWLDLFTTTMFLMNALCEHGNESPHRLKLRAELLSSGFRPILNAFGALDFELLERQVQKFWDELSEDDENSKSAAKQRACQDPARIFSSIWKNLGTSRGQRHFVSILRQLQRSLHGAGADRDDIFKAVDLLLSQSLPSNRMSSIGEDGSNSVLLHSIIDRMYSDEDARGALADLEDAKAQNKRLEDEVRKLRSEVNDADDAARSHFERELARERLRNERIIGRLRALQTENDKLFQLIEQETDQVQTCISSESTVRKRHQLRQRAAHVRDVVAPIISLKEKQQKHRIQQERKLQRQQQQRTDNSQQRQQQQQSLQQQQQQKEELIDEADSSFLDYYEDEEEEEEIEHVVRQFSSEVNFGETRPLQLDELPTEKTSVDLSERVFRIQACRTGSSTVTNDSNATSDSTLTKPTGLERRIDGSSTDVKPDANSESPKENGFPENEISSEATVQLQQPVRPALPFLSSIKSSVPTANLRSPVSADANQVGSIKAEVGEGDDRQAQTKPPRPAMPQSLLAAIQQPQQKCRPSEQDGTSVSAASTKSAVSDRDSMFEKDAASKTSVTTVTSATSERNATPRSTASATSEENVAPECDVTADGTSDNLKARPKMKQLFWEKLPRDAENGKTIWSIVGDESSELQAKLESAGVFEQVARTFTVKERIARPAEARTKPAASASLMPPDLQQTFEIRLHKYAQMSADELVVKLLSCDDDVLAQNDFLGLQRLLEQDRLKAALTKYCWRIHDGAVDRSVATADSAALSRWDYLYVRLFVDCGHYWPRRMQSLRFFVQLEHSYDDLQYQLETLRLAASQIERSRRFQQLLLLVLTLGNYMNHASRCADGFRISMLGKLCLTKGDRVSLTFLHLVERVARDQLPEVADFSSELDSIAEAARLNVENIQTEVRELEKSFAITQRAFAPGGMLADRALLHPQDRVADIIGPWLDTAKLKIDALRQSFDAATEQIGETLRFFGEPVRDAHAAVEFFALIGSFCQEFQRAARENKAIDEDLARTKQRRQILQKNNITAEVSRRQKTRTGGSPVDAIAESGAAVTIETDEGAATDVTVDEANIMDSLLEKLRSQKAPNFRFRDVQPEMPFRMDQLLLDEPKNAVTTQLSRSRSLCERSADPVSSPAERAHSMLMGIRSSTALT